MQMCEGGCNERRVWTKGLGAGLVGSRMADSSVRTRKQRPGAQPGLRKQRAKRSGELTASVQITCGYRRVLVCALSFCP